MKANDSCPRGGINPDRFWSHVTIGEEGCWVWTASIQNNGYGMTSTAGERKSITAHRASWRLAHGEIPPGMCVLHTCDNRKCVNPAHLWLGTQKENVHDMMKKGRRVQGHALQLRGHMSPHAKLTLAQVSEIRAGYLAGKGTKDLAAEYGVGHVTVWQILEGRRYKDGYTPELGRKIKIARDALYSKNAARGERQRCAKLTSEIVLSMRRRAAEGVPLKDMATEYGISRGNASLVVSGKTWAHVGCI